MISPYKLLPFKFRTYENDILITNDVGNYYFLTKEDFSKFVNKEVPPNSDLYFDLLSKNFFYDSNIKDVINFLSTAYRTKKKHLYDFTSLHMLVMTHRCNQKCSYCHASSEPEDAGINYDMDIATACKCVDTAFNSPSEQIKFEFQGGEPLLNFKTIKYTVEYVQELAKNSDKKIQFVICTNLTKINQNHIDFIKDNNIYISTSLDGPKNLHDQCRKFCDGAGTYDIVTEKIRAVQESLGPGKVSALLTVSIANLKHLEKAVDEYVALGLPSIFLRMMNPHGSAFKDWLNLGYSVGSFVSNYKKALLYIIKINKEGVFFPEEFAALLLRRILTPFSTGFVDLQSPSGAGIAAVAYETNGDVFVADEGRMLAKRTGDKTFCIGNVNTDGFDQIFCSDKLIDIIRQSTIEAVPGCAWCAYQPYCGSDPIRCYLQFGDFGLSNSKTDFCRKHKATFDTLFSYLFDPDDSDLDVFWSWIRN